MFPAGLEPATFRVWGGRDNHYTTETDMIIDLINNIKLQLLNNFEIFKILRTISKIDL